MNIADVTIDHSQYEGQDRLDIMFAKQDELRILYEIPILDLDLPRDQHIAREFAWNVTEELGEALEVFLGTKDRQHVLDEVADALAFYLELLLMSGLGSKDFEPPYDARIGSNEDDKLGRWFRFGHQQLFVHEREVHSMFLEKLALAINNLKNRKWRKTNLKTNKEIYHKALFNTFGLFVLFVESVGLNSTDLFDAHLRKHEVNLFRLRSKY